MRPVELAVRLTPRRNVLTQLLARIHQFSIRILEPHPGLRIIKDGAPGKYIADGRFDTGQKEAMGPCRLPTTSGATPPTNGNGPGDWLLSSWTQTQGPTPHTDRAVMRPRVP